VLGEVEGLGADRLTGQWPDAAPLSTERLELEPLRPGHAPEMAAVLADPALYLYTGGSPPSEQELAARYARQSGGVSPDGRQGWLNWVVRGRSDRRPVGIVQATLTAAGDSVNANLAWVVGTQDQGAGVATEASTAVMAWLLGLGISSFTAYILPGNKASATVATRLGLVRSPLLTDGETRWATPAP
jgi:RimJ/RimL family protein N-acetyltransferase